MGYTQPFFNVRKIAGGYSIYPDGVTGDDLSIYANPADSTPVIVLEGNAGIKTIFPSGVGMTFYEGATQYGTIRYDSGGNQMKVISTIDAKDLYLQTTGVGVVKFGTYTAGAATDSTGYITIKDAGGNTRKLMVQA